MSKQLLMAIVKRIGNIGSYLLVAGLVLFAWLPEGHAWWNDQWQYRKKILFDTTPTGADIKENLQEVPILLRLHSANFNFGNAKDDGIDIRFVSSDETKLLKHHIERYDPFDEIALVWVKLPRLSGGTNQQFIWMYYGNESAVGGQDVGGTYDVNQAVIYHFGETEGMPKDSTAHGNHAVGFTGGQALPSVIGNGINLNGAGDQVTIANAPSLDFAQGFTFSAWVRIMGPMEDACLFSREDTDQSLIIGVDQTRAYCQIKLGEGEVVATERTTDIPIDSWHLLSVTVQPRGRISIFLDGTEMNWADLRPNLPSLDTDLVIGGSRAVDHFFAGDVDEIQISNTARTAGWIRTAYASQGPDGFLLSFAQEEINESGGLPTFYLGTVAKNITLDGWAIIGILMLMAGLSWAVFLSKAFFLRYTSKDDEAFLGAYRGLSHPLALGGEDDAYQYSALHRVYRAGCQAMKGRAGNPHPDPDRERIPRKAMRSFNTALEKAYVEETQRLNAWLVILTMAITGGPFLGLLGTVWGVMNTFAAMAEAGEANIMA
ncbi:MAG TPA: DUF2341 domain-containing protein, partial [Desulfobacterales bacterium]|nr:DUF2341 domain-containing protein [Desulfobacterales bacterium]